MAQFDYSQNDPRWRDMPLGFSNYYYMGTRNGLHDVAAGCYVTSLAMCASSLGHEILPGDMNQTLKDHNLIDNQGDIIYNDILNRLFPDIQYVERQDWPTQPAPLDYFDVRNDLSTEIIVLIDTSPSPGLQQHWLRVVGWDGGSDIIVVDPWDGVRKGLSAYANKEGISVPKIIYAAIKYHRLGASPPDPVPEPVPEQPNVPVPPVVEDDPVVSTSPLPEPTPEVPAADPGQGTVTGPIWQPTPPDPSPAPNTTPRQSSSLGRVVAWIWEIALYLLSPRSKKKL